MNKTALITYHSAYNFGSVLQAFATQQTLCGLAHPADIINYRMDEQKYYYQRILHPRYGTKRMILESANLLKKAKFHCRALQFESFFSDYLLLTPEMSEPEEVYSQWQQYDTVISGSDQIWNKHSCELHHNEWHYMDPYLLKGFHGRKISYASSICGMTDEELLRITPELRQFDALSFRESVTAEKMSNILNRPVEEVLDPTFLLTRDEWIKHMNLLEQHGEKYILAYFLCGPKRLAQYLPILSKLGKRRGCKIKLITPFAYLPLPDRQVEYHIEYGPIDFLNALYNAEAVITGSYHGTILSVNFGKEIYSICKAGGAEFRKTDILERLGMDDRIIYDVTQISDIELPPIDYSSVYAKLDTLRRHSLNYLKTALEV